ncbi:MAG: TonB family protein [Ignavibacteriae bacterium]|nr:TonB family protein [Ignavibacteriota bacterium]
MPAKNPKFDLKLKYKRVFELGVIFSILLTIAAFKVFPRIEKQNGILITDDEVINLVDVEITKTYSTPPPPMPEIKLETPADEELPNIELPNTDLTPAEEIDKPKMITEVKEEDNELPPFKWVEKMPEIVGGLPALKSKVVYPALAQRSGIQGKVVLNLIIDKNGNPSEITVVKGIGFGCDEAAIEAVKATKFLPGEQRGKPVKVMLTLPIEFKLNLN